MLDLVSIGVIKAVPIIASPSESIAHVATVDLIKLLLMESFGSASVTRLLAMANHDYKRYELFRKSFGVNSCEFYP